MIGETEYEKLLPAKVDISMTDEITSEEEKLKQFTYDMFQCVSDEKNPLISPMSVYFVLSMAGVGAKGDTAAEIEQVLGSNHALATKIFTEELTGKDTDSYQFSIANGIWADDQMIVEEDYRQFIEKHYQSGFEQEDLSGDKVMNEINDWCKTNTHGMIPNIVEEPFDPLTRMALLNALYMKAEWTIPFEKESTYEENFYKEDGSAIRVQQMHAYGAHRDYIETSYGEGVVLPYKDTNLSFVAIKPKNGETVRVCMQQLQKEQLQELLSRKEDQWMNLSLPKYEIETKMDLASVVSKLGMETMFSEDNADFTGIGRDELGFNIYVSRILQKAKIKVDEEGTEAAAATLMVMMKNGAVLMQEEPLEMNFDSPFVYMIVHEPTGTPIFIGIMDEPVQNN